MTPYEGCTITGPYLQLDSYYSISIRWPSGTNKVMGFHRYLMEVHLGRYLEPKEQIHHMDKDPMNNEISNLMVVTPKEHGEFHRLEPGTRDFVCPWCGESFSLTGDRLSQLRRNKRARQSDNGPFCSRSCVTRYGNYKPPQEFTCPWCKVKFQLSGWRLSNEKSRRKVNPNKKDPYCSKHCADFGRKDQ